VRHFISAARLGLSILLPTLICLMSRGCALNKKPPPPPMTAPQASATVAHRPGPPIGMPTTRPASPSATAADALAVHIKWIALERTPANLPPLISQARLIAAPRAAEPLLASGQLTRDARIVPTEQVEAFAADLARGKYGRQAAIATTQAALPMGVTASMAIEQPAGRRLEVEIHRPTTMPSSAVATTTPAAPATQPSSGSAFQFSAAIEDGAVRRERLLLDPQSLTLPARVMMVFPSNFKPTQAKSIVTIIEIAPPSDSPEHQQAVARCNDDLQRLAAAAAKPSAPAALRQDWPGLAAALEALRQPVSARRAMVYLADQTGADLLGDVALVAPDETIAALADAIRQRTGDPPNRMDAPQLGWLLDAATLSQLASLQSAEKMPTELEGVLARYAGEAARNSGSLEELTRVRGRDQLRARLIAENFTYLEDSSPSARVRAYDWLNARGRAPAKYDPLGGPRERSAAIDAAVTAAATQAATSAPSSPSTPQASNTTGGAP
jgi:hypothetical protein